MTTAAPAVAPRERPILFSAPMVRALLAGTKTQTRRTRGLDAINAAPAAFEGPYERAFAPGIGSDRGEYAFKRRGLDGLIVLRCPYGRRGDRLWVRERARRIGAVVSSDGVTPSRILRVDLEYEADNAVRLAVPFPERLKPVAHGRRLSMGCYREASRLLLEITDVRVERLQDISEDDAVAEGIAPPARGEPSAGIRFMGLWETINGADAWGANPWIWAITFRRVMP